MRAQELLIDNTANNLANVNTTAFKRSHINFADLMYDIQRAPGALSATGQVAPIGTQIGNGTRAVGTTKVNTMGVLTETGIDTHLAIEGDGFFKVTFPSGDIRYTRDGTFGLNDQRQLVTADGLMVEPAITIPIEAESFTISPDGAVSFPATAKQIAQRKMQLHRLRVCAHHIDECIDGLVRLFVEQEVEAAKIGHWQRPRLAQQMLDVDARRDPSEAEEQRQREQPPGFEFHPV
jgi:flagellar basal-body rod protein FlgG